MAPFRAEEEVDGGVGSSEGLLFKRRPLFAKADENTARSAAGRAALESVVLAAPCVLPQRGVAWRAESDERLVARFKLPPERPEVEVRIDPHGAIKQVNAARWGPLDGEGYGYTPCGCDVHAERHFGNVTIPSKLTVSSRFGTPRQAPFFKAEITAAEAIA